MTFQQTTPAYLATCTNSQLNPRFYFFFIGHGANRRCLTCQSARPITSLKANCQLDSESFVFSSFGRGATRRCGLTCRSARPLACLEARCQLEELYIVNEAYWAGCGMFFFSASLLNPSVKSRYFIAGSCECLQICRKVTYCSATTHVLYGTLRVLRNDANLQAIACSCIVQFISLHTMYRL